MSKNKKIGISIWAIAFILSVFFALVIPVHYSNTIVATISFDVVAYVSVLILWMNIFKHPMSADDTFYNTPALIISTAYLIIQLILCIAVGLLVDKISFKFILTLNVVLMAVVWILILSTIIAKDHAQHVDSRQKDHHVEL